VPDSVEDLRDIQEGCRAVLLGLRMFALFRCSFRPMFLVLSVVGGKNL
jgi:hypothetical protein